MVEISFVSVDKTVLELASFAERRRVGDGWCSRGIVMESMAEDDSDDGEDEDKTDVGDGK